MLLPLLHLGSIIVTIPVFPTADWCLRNCLSRKIDVLGNDKMTFDCDNEGGKYMKEKIMAIILSMVMLLGGTTIAFADMSNGKVASEDLAMAIAYDFLIAREKNEDVIDKLPNDYNLILSKTIYETQGVPSAYKFDIIGEDDSYHGYIVIGAQEEYAPVIEYSISENKGFLDSAEANEEIYYVGGYDYFAVNEDTGVVKDLSTHEEVQSASINTYNNSIGASDYSDMWETIYNAYEKKAIESRYIKDPSPLEEGYQSLNIRNIPYAMKAPYVKTSDFNASKNACGPVAATNLMIMAKYSFEENVLEDFEKPTIQNAYNELYVATKCNPNIGTFPNDLASGIDSYLTSIDSKYENATGNYQFVEDVGLNGLKNNVKNQVCQILQLNSMSMYSNHYVFTFGYEEYVHTDKSNVYFMIADGQNEGVRYILFDASKMDTVVTVEF